jgi:hypothetical protein
METAATAVKAARDLRKDGFADIRITHIETWEDCEEDSLANPPGPDARPASE